MANDIANATRAQFLTYWAKAPVNVRPSGPARVAGRVLNPSVPVTGSLVVDGAKGTGAPGAHRRVAHLQQWSAGGSVRVG